MRVARNRLEKLKSQRSSLDIVERGLSLCVNWNQTDMRNGLSHALELQFLHQRGAHLDSSSSALMRHKLSIQHKKLLVQTLKNRLQKLLDCQSALGEIPQTSPARWSQDKSHLRESWSGHVPRRVGPISLLSSPISPATGGSCWPSYASRSSASSGKHKYTPEKKKLKVDRRVKEKVTNMLSNERSAETGGYSMSGGHPAARDQQLPVDDGFEAQTGYLASREWELQIGGTKCDGVCRLVPHYAGQVCSQCASPKHYSEDCG